MPTPSNTARPYVFGRTMLEQWPLDPAITYLNHGTVGAVPKRVLAAQAAICAEIERQPARFLLRELADVEQIPMRMPPRMRTAAFALASFLRVEARDLAFVDNATTGCNAVLRSFPFEPADEILVTDHGYGAVTKAAQYVAGRFGGRVTVATLPFPGTTPAGVMAAIEAALTERTRMLVVDHITSGSALILPIAEIAALCRKRGVVTLVDGAHAPGMLDLDIPALDVDFYTGNLHKWGMSPRSCAILWAARQRQPELHPTVISWGYGLGMSAEFDLLGTRDPSPWLAAPEGVAFMNEIGLEAMRTWNHQLAYGNALSLTKRWGTTLPAPEAMYGSMVTIPLPDRYGERPEAAQFLKDALLYDDNIETQIHAFKGCIWIRLAAQVYNDQSDFERLREAIERRG